MSLDFKRRLPIPKEIREAMPVPADLAATKPAFDAEVAAIIRGRATSTSSSSALAPPTARMPFSST